MGPVLCAQHEMYAVSFAFIYAVYGYSFLASVSMEASAAQMCMVLVCFATWFLAGIEPTFQTWARMFDNSGIYAMAVSPIRWAMGYLIYLHMEATKETGSQFFNELLRYFTERFL